MQHLAVMLLKVCVSSRVATLWKFISLAYKLSILNSENILKKYILFTTNSRHSLLHSSFRRSCAYSIKGWIILGIPAFQL
jgi:hypothetical protein